MKITTQSLISSLQNNIKSVFPIAPSLFETQSEDVINSKNGFTVIYKNQIPYFVGEFWTAKQRQASSLHEISYRACFKPQLPEFFINNFTFENDIVYDPFAGRGTTLIEAGLLGRNIIANDINPLSKILIEARINIPSISEIEKRLIEISYDYELTADIDLSMFYDAKTLAEIISLKAYFINKAKNQTLDNIDQWIRMIATNRLTGHSSGFFSVYTFPPNIAVSSKSQIKINQKRNQQPQYRDTKQIILKKSRQLLSKVTFEEFRNLKNCAKQARYLNKSADKTHEIADNTITLTVASPPFLDIVQYADDNWLRCWFCNIDITKIEKSITHCKKVIDWEWEMSKVFRELYRVTKTNGYVAFEVGEVRNGKINLDENIINIATQNNFRCLAVIINQQDFTKTANIWGIKNNSKGTNSNRVVLLKKHVVN